MMGEFFQAVLMFHRASQISLGAACVVARQLSLLIGVAMQWYDFRSCFNRIEIICPVLHHALAL